MVKKEEVKVTTVRMPKTMWIKLRRLQEKGEIKSIHQACIDGLEVIIKKGE